MGGWVFAGWWQQFRNIRVDSLEFGGFITKKWVPHFIAARRGNTTLEVEYEKGHISNPARRIYNTVLDYGTLPLHVIKEFAGFGRDEKSKFDNALIELQMKMYLTMCGRQPKISAKGEEYGWSRAKPRRIMKFTTG
ncbi:MAG: AlkZ-related protein [Bacillota bacterium]